MASVTLPNPTNGYIGLFAISGARFRSPGARPAPPVPGGWATVVARTVTGPGLGPYLPWSAWPAGDVPPAPSSQGAIVRLQ